MPKYCENKYRKRKNFNNIIIKKTSVNYLKWLNFKLSAAFYQTRKKSKLSQNPIKQIEIGSFEVGWIINKAISKFKKIDGCGQIKKKNHTT